MSEGASMGAGDGSTGSWAPGWSSAISKPSGDERAAEVAVAVEAASQSPSLAAPSSGQLNIDAAEHLESAARLIAALVGRSAEQVDVRDAAITMHLARRSYSAYRVAKYRWLEAEVAAGRYQPQEAYRWLEA